MVYDSHIPTTREDTPITTTDTATFTDSDLFAAIKVTDYVNRSTDTALADLVRHAAMMGVTYLRRGTPETSFTGKHNDELYGKAIAFAQAAQIATSGAITDAEIIAAARVEAAS